MMTAAAPLQVVDEKASVLWPTVFAAFSRAKNAYMAGGTGFAGNNAFPAGLLVEFLKILAVIFMQNIKVTATPAAIAGDGAVCVDFARTPSIGNFQLRQHGSF